MARQLAQGALFIPVWVAGGAVVFAIKVQIMRLSDGLWLDWNDGTFKNGGWITKGQTMVADDDEVWSYAAGWTVPLGLDDYQLVFMAADTPALTTWLPYEGEVIQTTPRRVAAVNDAAATATDFVTTLTETVNDFHKGSFWLFRDGALVGQVRKITAFNGITKAITTEAFTSAPANGDKGEVINS